MMPGYGVWMQTEPAKRRGPRGSYAKSSHRREIILDAALEVFAASGYRAGSVKDVAARVGMSDAGLLHHFPNKSALLKAVLDQRDQNARAIVPEEPGPGLLLLRAVIDLASHNASTPGVVELYCTLSSEAASPDHPAHHYFLARYERIRSLLAAAFRDIQRRALLVDGVEPEKAAIATIAIMDGLQVQWLLSPAAIDMAWSLERFLSGLVIGGLDACEQPQVVTPV
jgi:AcrR family transcriptional regulator